MQATKSYTPQAHIVDLELIKRYQERENKAIESAKISDWELITKKRSSNFKYKLINEALTSMFEDGYRPGCCLYTLIENFDATFGEDY